MKYSDMVAKLAKPGSQIMEGLTDDSLHILHMAVGIMGEVVELEEGITNHDMENIIEELGDIEFYLTGLSMSVLMVKCIGVKRKTDIVFTAGKILDHAKKHSVYCQPITVALGIAMGELRFILDNMYKDFNISRDLVLQSNMDKLAVRYGEKFEYTNAAAQRRDDKK